MQAPKKQTSLKSYLVLPNDMVGEIYSFLGLRSLLFLARVSRESNKFVRPRVRRQKELFQKLLRDVRIPDVERMLFSLDLQFAHVCDDLPTNMLVDYACATTTEPVKHQSGLKLYENLLSLLVAKHIFQSPHFSEFFLGTALRLSRIQQQLHFTNDNVFPKGSCAYLMSPFQHDNLPPEGVSVALKVPGKPPRKNIWELPGSCVFAENGLIYRIEANSKTEGACSPYFVPEFDMLAVLTAEALCSKEPECIICMVHPRLNRGPCCDECQPVLRKAQFSVMVYMRARKYAMKR